VGLETDRKEGERVAPSSFGSRENKERVGGGDGLGWLTGGAPDQRRSPTRPGFRGKEERHACSRSLGDFGMPKWLGHAHLYAKHKKIVREIEKD